MMNIVKVVNIQYEKTREFICQIVFRVDNDFNMMIILTMYGKVTVEQMVGWMTEKFEELRTENATGRSNVNPCIPFQLNEK